MLLLISTVLTLFTFCYSSDSSDEIKKLYYNAESNYRSAKDDPAKYDLAIDDYEKAFEKSKNGSEDINKKFNTLIRYKMALCSIKKGDYKKALEYISDLENNPKIYDEKAYREGINYLWLYILFKNEKFNDASKFQISKFEKSRFRDDATYIIAESNRISGEYEKAREAYAKLKGQYEEEGKYRVANCLLNIGVKLYKEQDANADQKLKEASINMKISLMPIKTKKASL